MRSSSASTRRRVTVPARSLDDEHALDLGDARLEHAQPAAADRYAARVEHDHAAPGPENTSSLAKMVVRRRELGAEPLADELHVAREQLTRGGRAGSLAADLDRAAGVARAQGEDRHVVLQQRRELLGPPVDERDERLGVQRPGLGGEQVVEALFAEQLAGAPRLREAVGEREQQVAELERDLLLTVRAVVLDAQRQPRVAELERAAGGRQQARRGVAAVGPAQAAALREREEHRHERLGRVRGLTSRLVCSSTAAGESQSHVRASTKKRTIALRPAVSRPLPLTSPIRIARPPEASRQRPKKSPPPASCPAGS